MFTGIVEAVGRIVSIVPLEHAGAADMRLTVDAGTLALDDVVLGDSIAIQGACMTVVDRRGTHFAVDISHESLLRTAGLDRVDAPVNLEKALRAHDRLGGHLVAGHVDGTGTVTRFGPVGVADANANAKVGPATDARGPHELRELHKLHESHESQAAIASREAPASHESYELRILAPASIGRYLAYKGSITVNGVSLTVNTVTDLAQGCEFSINVIPHTLAVTTLGELTPGATVNLEVDLIARYVERMLGSSGSAPANGGTM